MRILLSTDVFWPRIGGVEVISADLVRSFQERGHDVTVVANREPGEAETGDLGGVPVLRRPFRGAQETMDVDALFAERRWMAALMRDLRPDLVHVFQIGANLLFHMEARRAHPAPLVVSLHIEPVGEVLRPETVVGRALREADWVTACSRGLLDRILAATPEIADRASPVVNRLPRSPVDPDPLPFDPPTLLFLGRLVNNHKGFDAGLSAFARVAARRDDVRLVVAGDGDDRAGLERQTAELDLSERVHFTGLIAPSETDAMINSATAVVMPSRFDPYPMVALETARMGRPLVAFAVGGLPEIIRDGETGLLVAPDDIGGLADAMDRLLGDPDMARALGRAAREHSLTEGSWEGHVDEYEAVYERARRRFSADLATRA